MTYGLPYQGSKNSIAEELVNKLPAGNRFVDLFGGGGAIAHAAALSGKYNSVLYNELDPVAFKAFKGAIDGTFNSENRFIDRETFFRLRDEDPYASLCFSFGNDGHSYFASPDNESFSRDAWDIVHSETPRERRRALVFVFEEL